MWTLPNHNNNLVQRNSQTIRNPWKWTQPRLQTQTKMRLLLWWIPNQGVHRTKHPKMTTNRWICHYAVLQITTTAATRNAIWSCPNCPIHGRAKKLSHPNKRVEENATENNPPCEIHSWYQLGTGNLMKCIHRRIPTVRKESTRTMMRKKQKPNSWRVPLQKPTEMERPHPEKPSSSNVGEDENRTASNSEPDEPRC